MQTESIAPIACLHFNINIWDIGHVLCFVEKEPVAVFVLAYFAT